MRYLALLGALLFALVALSPAELTAKPGGGGGGGKGGWGGGGWGGGGYGRGYGGWGGYYGNGYYGGDAYYQPVNPTPYVVQSPIIENPTPAQPVRIINPAANKVTLSYTLDGSTRTIAPGTSQDLMLDHAAVIDFSRGGNFGQGRYGLEPGLYTFSMSDHGWELYHSDLPQTASPGGSANNPMPPTAPPTNPMPSAR
jgi:hypothetical protein